MDTALAPIDVAQHLPFIDRYLVQPAPAIRRALWLVAEGQVETDGEPCPVRARGLAEGATPGEAGRTSVVLNELEERGVLVRYRGRGRRPHLWSFRPGIERWQGFHWGGSAGDVAEAIGGCFCRAVGDLVARFPGQSVVEFRRRAKFELLSRDHIRPPGLFLVETRDKDKGRATKSQPPGLLPVDTRDNDNAAGGVSLLTEELEIPLLSEEEKARFDRLKRVLEYHARGKAQVVMPGKAPELRLMRLARALDDSACKTLCRHFDTTAGDVQIPSGSVVLESMGRQYLPAVAAAL
jgi:hypothetical protein